MDSSKVIDALGAAQSAYNLASKQTAAVQPWSAELVRFLALSVLGFSGLALIVVALLMWRANASAPDVLRAIGVVSILAFSALLLVVGYDNQQLTPIIGLFGAIGGYLLGKDSKAP